MLEVKIFRFNAKTDILAYYKPYFFENFSFATLKDLLAAVKKNDPYFDFEGVDYVKIDRVVTALDTDFAAILERFGEQFEISPLDTRRAKKDLISDDGDFWAKFEPFAKFGARAREIYARLAPYFYADLVREYEPNFVGAAAIMLAKSLCEENSAEKAKILELISEPKNGVFIAQNLDAFIFDGKNLSAKAASDALAWARRNLSANAVDASVLTKKSELNLSALKQDFSGFKIAFHAEIPQIFAPLKAKIFTLCPHLPCGFEILGVNRELAVKFASEILFDAYDSGADFLCAKDEREFYMFDTLSRECEKAAGREIGGFYVLRASELAALAGGEIPQTLDNHKLKVALIAPTPNIVVSSE